MPLEQMVAVFILLNGTWRREDLKAVLTTMMQMLQNSSLTLGRCNFIVGDFAAF